MKPKKKSVLVAVPEGGKAALNDIVDSFRDALRSQDIKLKDLRYDEVVEHLYSFLDGMLLKKGEAEETEKADESSMPIPDSDLIAGETVRTEG